MLQLERAGQQDSLEYRIVRDFMDALGKRRIPKSRAAPADVEEVQEALARIGRLEPRPGRAFLPDNDQYVSARGFCAKRSATISPSRPTTSRFRTLRISNTYKDLMSQGENNAEVKNYIREKIRAGKFLIKSLHQRQQTILTSARKSSSASASSWKKASRI
jgi:RNA polymerase sigma-54 factor